MNWSAMPAAVIAEAVVAAKAYLRVESGEEDAVLGRLAGAAIGLAEAYCGQALIARGFSEEVAAGVRWRRLGVCPVTTIDTVEAVNGGVLAVGTYAIDIDGDAVGWVRTVPPIAATRVRIGYRAGIASDWATMPQALTQGVVLLIAHLFAHRDDDSAPPAAVAALWRPYRRLRLGAERRA
jgi:uncharacterized phiE125 gp8 family phage protein